MHRSLALCLVLIGLMLDADGRAEDVYSPGGWATLHRGPANRRLVSDVTLASDYTVWTALEGAAVLTAPTMSPDGRTLYVTTGRGEGQANLHAFDLDGEPLWRSEPWGGPEEGVDPCAILSSAIVDAEGDLYIGDCNQLFAFRPDGRVKWVVPLPAIQGGDWQASERIPVNALTTAVFTKQGHVLGVTNAGDVIVVDRATGESKAPPMRLPGHVPPLSTTVPMSDSVFGDGLVDPEIRVWAWQLLFGGAMRSANTPAVDLDSGRVFVAATSTTEGKGALYALDLVANEGRIEISIAFATEMGPGSGSSPALSLAGDVVYVSDEVGVFYAIDAESGALRWQVQTKSTSAAAAVGSNGDIYSLQAYGPALVALTEEGAIRWQSDLAALAADALAPSWLLGDPVAVGNGNPSVVSGGGRRADRGGGGDNDGEEEIVLLPVAYGFETHLGRRIPWLVESALVAIDAETGRGLRNVVTLADDSTGITSVLPDGTIINSLGTAITSSLGPLAGVADWILPDGLRLLHAVGGIQVSRPRTRDTVADWPRVD
jgi:outer membrane protein assembly factor BamB